MLIHHSPNGHCTERGAGLEFIDKCYFTEGSVIYELRLVVLDDSMRS